MALDRAESIFLLLLQLTHEHVSVWCHRFTDVYLRRITDRVDAQADNVRHRVHHINFKAAQIGCQEKGGLATCTS